MPRRAPFGGVVRACRNFRAGLNGGERWRIQSRFRPVVRGAPDAISFEDVHGLSERKTGIVMRQGEPGAVKTTSAAADGRGPDPNASGWVIETVVSPFHCLYQDALHFHTQSKRAEVRSDSEASRLCRAALVLYLASAEALVHQAAIELGRPELAAVIADPGRPLALAEAWRLLPAIIPDGPAGPFLTDQPPWPQFAELLALRGSWAFPGRVADRRAYYRSARQDGDYEPLLPHQSPSVLNLPADRLTAPRTGLPLDPYALRPRHLDTARGVLDASIEALDRRLGGALTRDQRHRREPIRVVHPAR